MIPGRERRAARLSGCSALLLLAVGSLCGCGGEDAGTTLTFWAMGREGEVVQELVRDFEEHNPRIAVDVQQIPWSAAHEKLLTAFVGRSTPDLTQLGNTWVAEFAALEALAPLGARAAASVTVDAGRYFSGIWDTNLIAGELYGIPWYVDTRVLFYRADILEEAGYSEIPDTWTEWRRASEAVKRTVEPGDYALFLPVNEWTQPVIFGLQAGSSLLKENATRGAFSEPEFRRAFEFYVDFFREGLAPPVANTEIANVYQEFARATFSMYITGPWNLGEFRRRLPDDLQDDWSTAPLPGPGVSGPGVSLAGGSSLVLFERSRHKDEAWRLIEFLSRPEQQARFYHLTGDLPARVEAWDDPQLKSDPAAAAFRRQLEHVVPTPKIPEWEQIAARIQERAEEAVRGAATPAEALAALDSDVDRILAKRRWLLERGLIPGAGDVAAAP
ncbi:MAG: extracellular solute-binding protein [Candidatus Eisenbacteria bacterium]|nr:extracellular solute-binding protein [Candidatus Eisenbacteria bacterium]